MSYDRRLAMVIASVALGLPAVAQAQGTPYYGYGPGMMSDGGWFHMLFGFLMMLLFIGIIVLLVVLGVRWLSGSELALPA
jgi:putative membrane protein